MAKANTIAKVALPLAVAAGLGLGCAAAIAPVYSPLAPAQAWASASDASYADGEYSASAKGIGGDVPVTVTIKGGKIASVEVGDNSETQGIGSKAIEQLPAEIVKANGTEGVDAVSGASVTSKAIFKAVDDCLEQAQDVGTAKVTAADDKSANGYADGEYSASAKGIGGDVPVTVTIKGGKIADVTVGDNSETIGIGSKAIEQLPAEIVKANGTEGVDGVSGASVTSKAIFTAVEDCLNQAGTTDVKPETPKANTSSGNKAASSSDSLIVSTNDHLGTTRFGKISVTIPDTYTCEKYEQGTTSDGTPAAEAAYSRILAKSGAVVVKEIFMAGTVANTDDPTSMIDTLTTADLQATSSDGSFETIEEMSELDNGSYFGLYKIKSSGLETLVLSGGAVDEDGNLLFLRVLMCGDADTEDAFEVVDSIEITGTPESPSSSPSISQQAENASAETDGEPAESTSAEASADETWYNDGEYDAYGKGIGGKVPVTVTIEGGVITNVEIGDNSETQGIGSKAIEQLPAEIVAANGTEGVDGVSGASVTSKAIFTAVEDCLDQAGMTDVKPESAKTSGSSSSRASSESDSSDHLGTVHFDELSITIPDGYECSVFKTETLGTRALYQSDDSLSLITFFYLDSQELADEVESSDDGGALILATAMSLLGDTVSDWEAVDGLEIQLTTTNNTYVGLYAVRYGDQQVPVVVGGAIDSQNRILAVADIALSEDGQTEAIDIISHITGGVIPGPSSSSSSILSSTSGSSSRSSSSSHTPTRAEQNALDSALSYLSWISFSRSGLIDQLEYEGYTTSEAEYAVDHCGADWDEQAVLKAKEYLSWTSFSRSGLIDQLEYEGFTYSQASAAATAVGL